MQPPHHPCLGQLPVGQGHVLFMQRAPALSTWSTLCPHLWQHFAHRGACPSPGFSGPSLPSLLAGC